MAVCEGGVAQEVETRPEQLVPRITNGGTRDMKERIITRWERIVQADGDASQLGRLEVSLVEQPTSEGWKKRRVQVWPGMRYLPES